MWYLRKTCLISVALLLGLLLQALGIVQAAEPGFVIDHATIDNTDKLIPIVWLNKARNLDICFGHHSVGSNLLDGLDALSNSLPERYKLAIVDNVPASWFDSNGGVAGYEIGENENPQSKLRDFSRLITARGVGQHAGVAGVKFCFVDIGGGADVSKLWNSCRSTMEGLENAYPKVRFIWFTCPITSSDNAKRNAYNSLVRSYCRSKGKILFDIADIESYDAKGNLCKNASGPSLCKNYSEDGEHPDSEDGKKRLARAWWWMMARLAGWGGQ